ncbi:MAG: hypothetical protein JWQ11_4912, partial [Rhizobacter sp.]|nr:hypothetical protein [Rhizobacter sp.]
MTQFITIKEIRVINGLSRGAALPLETPLYVGSNPDCEIYLADPGIADRHLLLELDETGKVTILDLTKAEAIPIEQAESSMFQAGDVKLLWCESDKSWEASVAASQEHQPRSSQSETSLSAAVALRRSRNLRTVALVSCAVVILAIL